MPRSHRVDRLCVISYKSAYKSVPQKIGITWFEPAFTPCSPPIRHFSTAYCLVTISCVLIYAPHFYARTGMAMPADNATMTRLLFANSTGRILHEAYF